MEAKVSEANIVVSLIDQPIKAGFLTPFLFTSFRSAFILPLPLPLFPPLSVPLPLFVC